MNAHLRTAGLLALIVGFMTGDRFLVGQGIEATSRPMPASRPDPKGKNLTTEPGVILTKFALTEEEEEERKGRNQWENQSWDNLPDGRVSMQMQGTPEEILNYLSRSHDVLFHGVKLPEGQYQIKVEAVRKDLFAHAAKAISEAFKVRVAEEDRDVDAYRLDGDIKILKALPRPETPPDPYRDAARRTSASTRRMQGLPAQTKPVPAEKPMTETVEDTLGGLAISLSDWLKMPVTDGTGLAARYRIKLEWSPDKPLEGITKSLSSQGLKLVPAKKKVLAVHIDPAGAATKPAAAPN